MTQHVSYSNVPKFDESILYDTPEAAGMECQLELKDVDAGHGEGNGESKPEYVKERLPS
jgi:hypothetical protein